MSKMAYVKNNNTGLLQPADFFFADEAKFTRLKLNIERGKLSFSCEFCGSPLKLKAGSSTPEKTDKSGVVVRKAYVTTPHWYHAEYKSERVEKCPYYAEHESRDGHFSPETTIHFNTKLKLAYWLNKTPGVSAVNIEKYIISDINHRRRKPDVWFRYKGQNMSFEVQQSYLSPSDLTQRVDFFKKNKIVNFWVFPYVGISELRGFHRDTYYDNKENLHVFDEECDKESESRSQVVLKTFFKVRRVRRGEVYEVWEKELTTLDGYSIDNNFIPFVFDPKEEADLLNVTLDLMNLQKEIKEKRRFLIEGKNELKKLIEKHEYLRESLKEVESSNKELMNLLNEKRGRRESILKALGEKEVELKSIQEKIDKNRSELQLTESKVAEANKVISQWENVDEYWQRNIHEKINQYKIIADKIRQTDNI